MSDKPDKWVQLVSDLIERTQSRKIKWSSYIPKDSPRVRVVYRAVHKDKGLRLYRREEVSGELAVFASVLHSAREALILEVVDAQQNSLWTFPEVSVLADLYEAVRYQVAGIDEFLVDLLAK